MRVIIGCLTLVCLLCLWNIFFFAENYARVDEINKEFLELHNSLRSQLWNTDRQLEFDPQLADRAQKWAEWLARNISNKPSGWNGMHPNKYGGNELCKTYLGASRPEPCSIEDGIFKCERNGQNIATFSSYSSRCVAHPAHAVNIWFNEIHEPDRGKNKCREALYSGANLTVDNDGVVSECGHFSQLAWKNATKMGCGKAEAKVGKRGSRIYYVCNYDQGNTVGSDPRIFLDNLPQTCMPGNTDCPPLRSI